MTTLQDKLDKLSKEDRDKVEARAQELIEEAMTLQELRKAEQLTQAHLASVLGIGQDEVSRIEQRSDLLLSTLQRHINGMGGTLSLVVEMPGKKPVRLSGFGDLHE